METTVPDRAEALQRLLADLSEEQQAVLARYRDAVTRDAVRSTMALYEPRVRKALAYAQDALGALERVMQLAARWNETPNLHGTARAFAKQVARAAKGGQVRAARGGARERRGPA
jgi:hypothetical protein